MKAKIILKISHTVNGHVYCSGYPYTGIYYKIAIEHQPMRVEYRGK